LGLRVTARLQPKRVEKSPPIRPRRGRPFKEVMMEVVGIRPQKGIRFQHRYAEKCLYRDSEASTCRRPALSRIIISSPTDRAAIISSLFMLVHSTGRSRVLLSKCTSRRRRLILRRRLKISIGLPLDSRFAGCNKPITCRNCSYTDAAVSGTSLQVGPVFRWTAWRG
jgi:hypothetical protein